MFNNKLTLARRWNTDGDVANQCRRWANVSMLAGYLHNNVTEGVFCLFAQQKIVESKNGKNSRCIPLGHVIIDCKLGWRTIDIKRYV